MSVKSSHREQVKALVTGNVTRAEELNAALPDEERSDFNKYLSAVFAVLLEVRFGQETSVEAVAEFANEMVGDFDGTGIEIDPRTIESVIRAALGEREAADGYSADDIFGSQLLVTGKIVMQDPTVSADIERYLDDAAALLDEGEQLGR